MKVDWGNVGEIFFKSRLKFLFNNKNLAELSINVDWLKSVVYKGITVWLADVENVYMIMFL